MEIRPGMKLAPVLAAGGGDPTVGRSQGGGIIGGLDDDVLNSDKIYKVMMKDGKQVSVDGTGTIVGVE